METTFQKIEPFLKEIVVKKLSNGCSIFSCVPKEGITIGYTGYFDTEKEAMENFLDNLVGMKLL